MSSNLLMDVVSDFMKLMLGLPRDPSDVWIHRFDRRKFKWSQEHPGVVERVFSENVAIIIVSADTGKPIWENEQKHFARALLFGNTSNPVNGESLPEVEALKEGDLVNVRLGYNLTNQQGIFFYYVKSFDKVGRTVEEEMMSKIRSPLTGFVEKMVSQNEGVIKFMAYSGLIYRATFSRENFYYKGIRLKDKPLKDFVQANFLVYLELKDWDIKAMKKLNGSTIIAEASAFWLKDDQRPRVVIDNVEDVPEEGICCNEDVEVNGIGLNYGPIIAESISEGTTLKGKLVSLEEDWGLVAVEEDVLVFYSVDVYFYGLQIEQLHLSSIFSPGQVVEVWLEEERVSKVSYGSPLPSSMRLQAISSYCVCKSIPSDIKNVLEDLNRQQSQG